MKVVLLGSNTKKEIEKRIQIVSSAGNLSRSFGTVTEVFENHKSYEDNLKLARAVVGYGHKSIAEHDYLVFALEDVSVLIEQILISYRLTSFTIKSRRNVDFRNVGFYVPNFKDNDGNTLKNNKSLQEKYKEHMESLFQKYGELVDLEIPVEDCRYILPYCFNSNIIMGCDANEFLRITCDLLYGKMSKITEVYELGKKFENIIIKYTPYLIKALEKEKDNPCYTDQYKFVDKMFNRPQQGKLLPKVNMTNYTEDADRIVLCNILMARYQISMREAKKMLLELKEKDKDIEKKLIKGLIYSKNQRELEQVNFSFEIPIELAVLTHITRHRMHSILIPDFVPMWDLENYFTPKSIEKCWLKEYKKVFIENKKVMEEFKELGVRDEDLVYFYLSGNACNIYTTMNGRTLMWISRMRCCNKAQYAIRKIAKDMVKEVKMVAPLIGSGLGPTCEVLGYCPEGKDSCKNRGVVIKKKDKVVE